jgi:hypothetical protein
LERCRAYLSISTNDPSSSNSSMPLAGGHLAAGVLLLDGALGSGTRDLGHAALEVGEFSGGRRGVDVLRDVGTADGFGVAGGHGPSLALGA